MNLFSERNRWLWHTAFWVVYVLLLLYTFGQIMPLSSAFGRVTTGLVLHATFAYLNWFWLIPAYFLQRRYLVYFGTALVLLITLGFLRFLSESLLPAPFVSSVTPIVPLRFIFIAFSFVSIWVVSSLFKLLEDRIRSLQRENELKTAQLHSELRFLKAQINPHFLFNTLNNVYSLAYLKSDLAAPSILKLSGMLRYMLYDCDAPKVPLQKEIDYLRDYIELQVLNPADRPKVTFEVQHNASDILIEPMLFVNFPENAFKHGNLSQPGAFIRIRLSADAQHLEFTVQNTFTTPPDPGSSGGMGIQNVRQRLALLYPGKHQLSILEKPAEFFICLHLTLK
ncbi:MAG: histidine kinase [Spirosomataceae bacterium]